jgi:hypothetical protein
VQGIRARKTSKFCKRLYLKPDKNTTNYIKHNGKYHAKQYIKSNDITVASTDGQHRRPFGPYLLARILAHGACNVVSCGLCGNLLQLGLVQIVEGLVKNDIEGVGCLCPDRELVELVAAWISRSIVCKFRCCFLQCISHLPSVTMHISEVQSAYKSSHTQGAMHAVTLMTDMPSSLGVPQW